LHFKAEMFATKRKQEEPHLSREEYDEQERQEDGKIQTNWKDPFAMATPNTLAARKMVTANKYDKKLEFGKYIKALNTAYYNWFKEQVARDPYAYLVCGAQDFIDHTVQLEDRYLRSNGEVLTFGLGDCGQLAHGIDNDEDLMVKFPRIVYSLSDKKVCGISCGGLHNAVFTESGQVYTWGCADNGSLGRGGDESLPFVVDKLANEIIVGIACGDVSTIAISIKGQVWGWGCYLDKEGKKWFPASNTTITNCKNINNQQNEPVLIVGLNNIVDIACGSAVSLARGSDGTLYSWGVGECGELGREIPPMCKADGSGFDIENIFKHRITPGLMYRQGVQAPVRDAKAIGCGSYHSMVVVTGGELLSCGLNNYGQLGLGDTTDRPILHSVDALKDEHNIVAVKGGVHHSLCLTSAGKLVAFGRSDSGQLGVTGLSGQAGESAKYPVFPLLPDNTEATAISCGGNHNLVLTSKNEVYTWGYGDTMALGHGKDADENTPKKINFSKAQVNNITVTQVCGGGQHSAIIGRFK